LAQIFKKDAPRTLHGAEEPYTFISNLKSPGAEPAATGFGLVLEGRVAGFSDGRAFHCWSETPDHRPVCMLGVTFSRVAFDDGEGKTLAEWRQ
jgi:hypothetical protein